jgi:hypothetical protein
MRNNQGKQGKKKEEIKNKNKCPKIPTPESVYPFPFCVMVRKFLEILLGCDKLSPPVTH